MTDDLDRRLAARFAGQDDPGLQGVASFELVRSRAAGIERQRKRRRRLLLLAAALVAALVAVPAIAISHTLVERVFGKPAGPALRDYIGRVLTVRPGVAFMTPPRYVAGVQTTRGLVLLWTGRRRDGRQCTGVEAAFGDADTVRMKLGGRTIADNGILCGSGPLPIDSDNAGLSNGQSLGSVHVLWGQVPARVRAVRLTFEDGRTQTAAASHGWVVLALEGATRRPGHRPILEQALDAHGTPVATERLHPWDYGGKEPALPSLDGPGSTLLGAISTPSGSVQLRLSPPGHGWQRQQCWGIVRAGRTVPLDCDYPARVAAAAPPPSTNELYLWGPRIPGLVVAVARRIDRAWLVGAGGGVRRGRIVRLTYAGHPQVIILAATGDGGRALRGIVTSRDRLITGALLIADRAKQVPGAATAPCFLAAPSAGAPTPTAACRALMATARPAVASER